MHAVISERNLSGYTAVLSLAVRLNSFTSYIKSKELFKTPYRARRAWLQNESCFPKTLPTLCYSVIFRISRSEAIISAPHLFDFKQVGDWTQSFADIGSFKKETISECQSEFM